MIFGCLRRMGGNMRGFSLVEVMAALLITGLIGLGAGTATIQVLGQGSRNSDYTTASRNAMSAVYWISVDSQMSQVVTPTGDTGFPLILRWTGWDSAEHEVSYTIEDGSLTRRYFIDGGAPRQTLVAEYINSASENTTCEYSGGVLSMTITATVGEGAHSLSVTRSREVAPRPIL